MYRSSDSPDDTMMKWKVKRRVDGSKYIVKRPLREDKKDVEFLTTDDDTMSEIKLGKFWSKTDRKKHLEKSKERRYRLELMNQQVTQNKLDTSNAPSNVAAKQMFLQKRQLLLEQQQKLQQHKSPPNTPEIAKKNSADTILSVTIL